MTARDPGYPDVIETPTDAALVSITSPGFHMRYPDVRHAARIPDGVRQAMEVSWNAGVFPERAVSLRLLEDVFIAEEGLVFDRAGRLLRDSITQHTVSEIERGHAAVREAMRAGIASTLAGTCVLCKKRGASNFGHWMIEMLPMAFLGSRHLGGENPRYIVPDVTDPLRKVIVDSLTLIGVDASRLVPCGPAATHVERLIMVEGLTRHGVFMSPLVLDCLDTLSGRIQGSGIAKILVTRHSAAGRAFIDERAIHRHALDQGYTLLEPGSLSLAAQIAAFKDATDIVGAMGAGMTNIAFAASAARVVTLAPALMPDTFFWFITGLKRQAYREIRCRQSGPIRNIAAWDTDLILDPDDLADAFA
jgi:capsular polysaccharide biosynthesis protein